MRVQPFRVSVPEPVLEDLRARLARTRWPDEIAGAGRSDGVALDWLRKVCEHWRDHFDWRAVEARVNALPNFRAEVSGLEVHFLHVRGSGQSLCRSS